MHGIDTRRTSHPLLDLRERRRTLTVAAFPWAAALLHAGDTCGADAFIETYIAFLTVTILFKFTLKCSRKLHLEFKFGNRTNKNRASVYKVVTIWLSPL